MVPREEKCRESFRHFLTFVALLENFGVATLAEPSGEKLLKFVEKSAGEIFLSGLRGAKMFQTRFGSFFGSFFAFFKPFFVLI